MSKREYSFDPECYELACHFFPAASEERLNAIAQCVQDTIEGFSDEAPAAEKPECGACDKPGEHCANVYGICSRHGGRAHETTPARGLCVKHNWGAAPGDDTTPCPYCIGPTPDARF